MDLAGELWTTADKDGVQTTCSIQHHTWMSLCWTDVSSCSRGSLGAPASVSGWPFIVDYVTAAVSALKLLTFRLRAWRPTDETACLAVLGVTLGQRFVM